MEPAGLETGPINNARNEYRCKQHLIGRHTPQVYWVYLKSSTSSGPYTCALKTEQITLENEILSHNNWDVK